MKKAGKPNLGSGFLDLLFCSVLKQHAPVKKEATLTEPKRFVATPLNELNMISIEAARLKDTLVMCLYNLKFR